MLMYKRIKININFMRNDYKIIAQHFNNNDKLNTLKYCFHLKLVYCIRELSFISKSLNNANEIRRYNYINVCAHK